MAYFNPLGFRLRLQLRPDRSLSATTQRAGKANDTPSPRWRGIFDPRCQEGFAVAYYGFTLGQLDVVKRRSRYREIWGILDFRSIEVLIFQFKESTKQVLQYDPEFCRDEFLGPC